MKISFKKIFLFMFLKYFVFYVFMMFKNSNYALIEIGNLNSFGDVFYYLWIFLFLPTVCYALFSAPIYYSFSKRNLNIFMLVNVGILIAEYIVYTYLASQSNWYNGMFNAIISIVCFPLVFWKEIGELFAEKRDGKSKGYL
jgi:hypothetical protein